MDGRVTPPTWGPPPPCKQALSNVSQGELDHHFTLNQSRTFRSPAARNVM